MEQYWTKKRVSLLLYADIESLDSFLNQFEPVLFTWMYYQVGADANIAADLTARTFEQTVQQIRTFNHAGNPTLFHWLKDLARMARDEGLLHWQLKPQRPWAWSQLPDPLLKTLSELRSEPLNETAADNPFVQEMVQAALTELDPAERELMMHRYSHLDTPEHITEEMKLTVEQVNDLLYKCRHSFRRVFFHLISSVNPGFSESNTGTGIEVMDNNLEKLLRATSMYQTPSETQQAMIRERFFQAAQQMADAQPKNKPYPLAVLTVSAAAVLLLGTILYLVWPGPDVASQKTANSASATKEAVTAQSNENDKPKPVQADLTQEELKMVFQLGQNGNLEALLEILKSGQFPSQLAAAHFIGKLGIPSSVEPLRQAERQWYPGGPKENPFAEAIAEISRRFPGQIPTPETAQAPQAPAKQEPNDRVSMISGSVKDFVNKPISGAKLQVLTNPLLSNQAVKTISQTVTDESGQYHLKQAVEGPLFLHCDPAVKELPTIRQAVLAAKEHQVACPFGGKTVIAGRLTINERPMQGLKLILSDSVDPEKAAFRSETNVDESGSFSYIGVRPGYYHLFSLGQDKKLVRFSSTQIDDTDIVAMNLSLQPVSVTVEYPEPNDVADAVLSLQFESLPSFEEKNAGLQNNGNLLFENVFPGTYVLKLKMKSGFYLQQTLDVLPQPQQHVSIEGLTGPSVSVKGKMLGTNLPGLCLLSPDQKIRAEIKTAADGSYEVTDLPAQTYTLACTIKDQWIELTTFDLQGPDAALMDFNLNEIVSALSPVYIIVADNNGLIVNDARIWLVGNEVSIVQGTGQGAFAAVPAGSYTLNAVRDGYGSKSKEIHVKKAPITADPSVENTFMIRLEKQ